jgi:dipeptidyl aminopeptidase/acylaminoacyl peptidase
LSGWVLPASRSGPTTEDATAPTVLHVHGNAGNITDHIGFTEHLPSAGFNVLIFDYRGYGQSEGRPWRRGPLIADTHAALDYLLSRTDVDPRRIGMYGQSLGGAIGLNVMAARPEIRAAAIESSFTSWRDEVASVLGGGEPSWWARAIAWLLIGDGHRVDEALGRIERPILLLHGDADTTVPITHGRRLKAAGGENVRLIELSGGQHNTLRDTHPHVDREVIAFFRQELFLEEAGQ